MYKKESLQQAINEYGNTVLRLAYSYMKDKQSAEDVFQDVFIKLYENLSKIDNEEHLKAWLIRVTSNICKNKLKSFEYSKTGTFDEGFEGSYTDNSENVVVTEAVLSLSQKYREVIHLFYYEDYQTKEIAKLLLKPEATVRSLLARGRELLKTALKGDYDFE